jgi:hypothetical protein
MALRDGLGAAVFRPSIRRFYLRETTGSQILK